MTITIQVNDGPPLEGKHATLQDLGVFFFYGMPWVCKELDDQYVTSDYWRDENNNGHFFLFSTMDVGTGENYKRPDFSHSSDLSRQAKPLVDFEDHNVKMAVQVKTNCHLPILILRLEWGDGDSAVIKLEPREDRAAEAFAVARAFLDAQLGKG